MNATLQGDDLKNKADRTLNYAAWISETFLQIVDASMRLVMGLLEKPEDRVKLGGYVCLRDSTSGPPILASIVGLVPDETKRELYWTFAQEKAMRLLMHPDHASSFQSRDDAKAQYPGAIRAGECAISFSGFPALADEAICLLVAIQMNWLTREEAMTIADISNNEYYRRVFPTDTTKWVKVGPIGE